MFQATRPVNSQKIVKELYSFEILSSTEWKYDQIFEPNLYFLILTSIKAKKTFSFKNIKNNSQTFPHQKL